MTVSLLLESSSTSTSRTDPELDSRRRETVMASRKISYREAINEALEQEMERDCSVVLIGTDIAGGAGGEGKDDAWGGVLGVTKGLYGKFPGRVLDRSEERRVGKE